MEKHITVLICEDQATTDEILKAHFAEGHRVTYAAIFDESSREQITEALDKIQDEE
jgi:hypothetical protein